MPTDEAIVLVGGLGTRLRGVVADVPKPLAPVAGRPFLAWLLDRLAMTCVRRVILATGHGAEQVEAAIGSRWNTLQVDYSPEPTPLGTGGAIALAATLLRGDATHVLNGDTYLVYDPAALEAATRAQDCSLGVALARIDDVARYGTVDVVEGRVCGFREKGGVGAGWINAGCYYLGHDALVALPAREAFSFETDVLVPQAATGSVAAFGDTRGFIDIGVPKDYFRAQALFGKDA